MKVSWWRKQAPGGCVLAARASLLVACLGLTMVGLGQASSYGASDASYASGGSGGYSSVGYSSGGDGGGGYGGGYGGGAERPRVNLGISLKVPAMKINLGRMNMPKISIRAKIKQGHGPKVINVPEMHIDTNSKIPGPEGARAVSHGSAGYEPQSGYSAQSGYQQQQQQYQAPSISYEAPASSQYGSPAAQEYAPSSGAGYAPEPSYEAPPAAGYEMASYDDSAAPASYSQQGYSAAAAASSYSDAAVAPAYMKGQQQRQPRQQYGAGQGAQSAGYQQQQAATSAPAAYSPPSSYQQAPSAYPQQAAASYAPPSYGASSGSGSGSGSGSSYSAPTGYSSNPRPSYGAAAQAIGYQPIQPEPGHTIITSTNDNHEGLTRLTWASEPHKDHGRGYGAPGSYGGGQQKPASYSQQASYPQQTSYSQQANYQQQASYQQPAPATYSAPSPPAYQQRPAQAAAAEDSYLASNQAGNYGARMGYSRQQQPQSGYLAEAY